MLSLEVNEVPPEVVQRRAETLFIETELGDGARGVHVQQQIPLTVRLFSSEPISDGTLSDPVPADTVVERLGDDRHYSTERNGRRYQVIERHYALFPERSGELKIPPVVFRGSVPERDPRRGGRSSGTQADRMFNDPLFDRAFRDSGFGSLFSSDPMGLFSPRRPISAQGKPLTVDVLPRPAGVGAHHWLPAQGLELFDSWQQQAPEWQVGKPVDRTITVRAAGLSGSQIPPLTPVVPDGVRSYPGKPRHQSQTNGERVFGISEQTFTYIPTQAGSLELPAIEVTWWDTSAGRQRTATLPRWQVQVAAGEMPAEQQPTPAPAAPVNPTTSGILKAPIDRVSGGDDGGEWITAALSAALALVLIWLLALAIRRLRSTARMTATASPATANPPTAHKPATAHYREAFNNACGDSAEPGDVARTLMDWARAEWADNPPSGLMTLAVRLRTGGDEVRALEHALYAPDEGGWDAGALRRALSRGLVEKPAEVHASQPDLAPLYPRR